MSALSSESPTSPAPLGEEIVMQTVEEVRKHHKWGPSTLKNRETCPGWKNHNREVAEGDFNAAGEGTKLHYACEIEDFAGLDDEQIETAKKCITYVKPLLVAVVEDHKELLIEILKDPVTGEPLTFGTADRVIVRRLKNGRLHIDLIDYKFGRWSVDDASINRQGIAYVVGVFERWPDVETITVHFLMPRRDEVTKHTFYRSEFPRLALIIRSIVNRADEWDRTRDPSMLRMQELNCIYCARAGTPSCPVSLNWAVAHAKKYKPLEVAEQTHGSQIPDPMQMRQLYIAVRVLEKMVDSAKQHIHAFSQTQDIPGFVRRERKGKVTVTDSILAWPVLLKVLGIDRLDHPQMLGLINCATWSYSDLSKLVTEGLKGKAKTEAVAKLWIALQDAECVRESEPTVYLQRDKEDVEAEAAEAAVNVTPPKAVESTPTSKSLVQGAAVE